jgi:hypothetical protein
MVMEDLCNFLHGEIIKLHDLSLQARRGRHDGAGFPGGVHVCDELGFMVAVFASPVRMRQIVGACLEKYSNHPSTGHALGLT